MFSTVEQLPWQLVGWISMLQRVRGESLIISGRQRGPTDRAKAKHKDFALHLEDRSSLSPAALTSHVSNCVGARRAEPVGATLLFAIFHPPPLSIWPQSQVFSFSRCLPPEALAATLCIHAYNRVNFRPQKLVESCSFYLDVNWDMVRDVHMRVKKKLLVGALGRSRIDTTTHIWTTSSFSEHLHVARLTSGVTHEWPVMVGLLHRSNPRTGNWLCNFMFLIRTVKSNCCYFCCLCHSCNGASSTQYQRCCMNGKVINLHYHWFGVSLQNISGEEMTFLLDEVITIYV